MSDNLFEENKSNKKNNKKNPIVQIMNVDEEVNINNINDQKNQNSIFNNSKIKNINNELKDKISEIGYSSNQERGLFGKNNNSKGRSLFGDSNNQTGRLQYENNINIKRDGLFENINNESKSLFGNSIEQKTGGLFDNSANYNQAQSLFENSITQGNNKKYYSYEDPTLDNLINRLEYNEKNNNVENVLVKIMEEIEDDDNINESTIKNQEKQNSTFINSLINLNNGLKDKIPDIKIYNINGLKEEIIEIYKHYNFFRKIKDNNYNICEKCGKNNFFFVKIVLQVFAIFAQKIVK